MVGAIPQCAPFEGQTNAVSSFPRYVSAWQASQIENLAWKTFVAFSPLGLTLVIGVILWMQADALAIRMAPEAETPATQSPITGEDIQRIAFSTVGLWVIARTIPDITLHVFELWFDSGISRGMERMDGYMKARIASYVVQLVFGLCLLLGSRGLSGVLNRIRGEAVSENDETADAAHPTPSQHAMNCVTTSRVISFRQQQRAEGVKSL